MNRDVFFAIPIQSAAPLIFPPNYHAPPNYRTNSRDWIVEKGGWHGSFLFSSLRRGRVEEKGGRRCVARVVVARNVGPWSRVALKLPIIKSIRSLKLRAPVRQTSFSGSNQFAEGVATFHRWPRRCIRVELFPVKESSSQFSRISPIFGGRFD